MSRYLVDRITGLPNVEVVTGAEVPGARGTRRRARSDPLAPPPARRLRGRSATCSSSSAPTQHRLAVGLRRRLDDKGFVRTGADAGTAGRSRPAASGVFAIGDVRSGSVKRVAAAVGEGAQVVATLHPLLSRVGGAVVANA